MRVNDAGRIVVECWNALPMHFPNVELDAVVVMPNHIHGTVVVTDGPVGAESAVGAGHVVRAQHAAPLKNAQPGSLGAIIRSLKSAATKRINETRHTAGVPVGKRNYFEHVIRNEKSLNAMRDYIARNPANWENDEENPVNL